MLIRPGRSFRLLAYQRMNPSVGDPEIQNWIWERFRILYPEMIHGGYVVLWGICFKEFPTFKCFRERKLTCRVAIPSDIGWHQPFPGIHRWQDDMVPGLALKRSSWLKNHRLDISLDYLVKNWGNSWKEQSKGQGSQVRPSSHWILPSGKLT